MKNRLNHVIPRHVGQTLFVKNEMVLVLVLASLSILVILTLGVSLNAFPTATAHVKKLALIINVKTHAQEFVVLTHSVKL